MHLEQRLAERQPVPVPQAGGDGDGSAVQGHGGLTDRLDNDTGVVGTQPGMAGQHIRTLEIDAVTRIATEQVR
ncbi:MAG: hypothetical protein M3495_15455, partial [Pseudomonadota bacterium]|nr:hypothetical protein [Pseudomonadota bacterium]